MNKFQMIRLFIFLIIYLIYSYFINEYLHSIGKNYYNNEDRVYDVCHKYLPNYELYENIGNYYIAIVSLLLIGKPSILFDVIAFMIPIYFIRSIFMLITILPNSAKCEYNSKTAFITGGCYDKIFSGHAAILFIITLLLNKNKIINFSAIIFLNAINVFIILLTRTHYTIDIIVSYLVSYLVYTNNIRL
jgi:hypothetical protein